VTAPLPLAAVDVKLSGRSAACASTGETGTSHNLHCRVTVLLCPSGIMDQFSGD
jgi:hypothetical protein